MQFSHLGNRKKFGICLIALEIIIFVMYSVFVRAQIHNDTTLTPIFYPLYQDVNVMILIGFGFLMTFIRKYAWSALSYTFFINAIVVQLYTLISSFWQRIFHGWSQKFIFINQKFFTAASYSVASVLIAFGAVLGRVGPLQLLIMAVVQIIGYTLNQQIIYNVIQMHDAGGSTTIHAFGAYFGLIVSFILGKSIPAQKSSTTYLSNVLSLLGTLFLWMFWPSFNAGLAPKTPYERTLIITNTILALTGSSLSCFVMNSLLQKKFCIDQIQNATLAGGVIIGASSGLLTNSGACLIIGSFGGVVSSAGFSYLQDKLADKGIYDVSGVHNLHGAPGLLGGLLSAIAIVVYKSDPLNNQDQISYLNFYSSPVLNRSFYVQGAIQVAGSFISVGIGLLFGLLAGFCILIVYRQHTPNECFDDQYNFQQENLLQQVQPIKEQIVRNSAQLKLSPQENAQIY